MKIQSEFCLFNLEQFSEFESFEPGVNSAPMHTDSKWSVANSAYECSGAKSFAKIRRAPLSDLKFRALSRGPMSEFHGIVVEFLACPIFASATNSEKNSTELCQCFLRRLGRADCLAAQWHPEVSSIVHRRFVSFARRLVIRELSRVKESE